MQPYLPQFGSATDLSPVAIAGRRQSNECYIATLFGELAREQQTVLPDRTEIRR
jgi:hypothetical protein